MSNRLGYPEECKPKKKEKYVRGFTKIGKCINYPCLASIMWMDSKPVNFITTGLITEMATITRKFINSGLYEERNITCPLSVSRYNSKMGGVDTHDQLRLQRYSIQLEVKF